MPKKFLSCVRTGGRVFTIKIGKTKYVHGCEPKGGGDAIYGEIKKKKKTK